MQVKILQILQESVPLKCKISPASVSSMANTLVEEVPSSWQEVTDSIGQFFKKSKLPASELEAICKEIYKSLIDRSVYTAPEIDYDDEMCQLDKPINPEFKLTTDQRKEKQKSKEELKAQEAYEKHIKTIKEAKVVIPPARVIHDKDESRNLDIILDKVNIIVGGKCLLEDSSLKLVHGRKYGLIGRNGIGKTCLMNALARGELEGLRKDIQILLVEQEIAGSDKNALELVLETDGERLELLAEQQQLENSEDEESGIRLEEIHMRLEAIHAFTAVERAEQILIGLGFTHDLIEKKTKHLSGGWRMRVSLARALFVQPDVLLLDEPTNHLDLDAVMWLEDYVQECSHTVVIVSHAREFLNIVCNEMIHYYDMKLTTYRGNYDQFEKTRSEKLGNQKKQYDKQQDKLQHMQQFIDKFRANNKRATLVQSRIKTIQKMDLIDEVLEDPSCTFKFPNPEPLSTPLLNIEDGIFGYDEAHPILKDMKFFIDMESRIAIVGANGAGKSTFLNLLVENLKFTEGNYYRNGKLRISMFTQHHVEQLNLMFTPVEQLMSSFPGSSQEMVRAHLSAFGLVGPVQLRPQYLLSGGQKSRVAFAIAVWNNPHILIMDEPTNHLDIDAINALIVALNDFTGGLIIVSHDQYFVSSICDDIWYIKNQRVKKFKGSFDDYKIALTNDELH